MILFDNTEYDNFFNPLCCKNKRIYYECILQLIEKSKSVPLLYETDAKDNFELFSMSADELKNGKFAACLHELTDNDRIRLQELMKNDIYVDVVKYMLCNDVKLEQEIVSLTLMKS